MLVISRIKKHQIPHYLSCYLVSTISNYELHSSKSNGFTSAEKLYNKSGVEYIKISLTVSRTHCENKSSCPVAIQKMLRRPY
jgi:arsenate reductase-like glutaredoxin family protein